LGGIGGCFRDKCVLTPDGRCFARYWTLRVKGNYALGLVKAKGTIA
jgi:hypothetical protein